MGGACCASWRSPGRHERWLPMLTGHRTWRDALDVEAVVFEGRHGWQRVVKNARVVRTTMR